MSSEARVLAVIPARGGSKRIPHKNISPFRGRPMIAHTVEAALETGLFQRVLVSTDDEKIAQVAREHGASVPFLRATAADDHTPVSEATLAALGQSEEALGERYEHVVQLMPNCPLRRAEHIEEMYRAFVEKGCDFLLSCCAYNWLNPWWAARVSEGGAPEPLFPEALKQRSQDLPPLYCITGAVWIARTQALRRDGTFQGSGHLFHALDWKASVDIDDFEDLAFAEAVAGLATARE